MAALDAGYTPSSLILDAPIEIDQGPGLPKWRPENFEKGFLGPTTMRVGIEKSRNLMAVRMAATLGMDKVASYANASASSINCRICCRCRWARCRRRRCA